MRCVFIYNPTSGKQRNGKTAKYVATRLKEKFDEVEIRPTGKSGDAGIFAKEACGNCDTLVISGGDGTLNEVVNAIAKQENRPKIAYLPTGTTNDLAHSLHISKNLNKALDIVLNGKPIKHDVFKVNDHFGIYVCCFGLFTKSSYQAPQKEKKCFGRLAYFRSGVKEIFCDKPLPLILKTEDKTIEGNFVLGILANSKYVAGYKISKNNLCNDGLVDLMLVKTSCKKHLSLPSILQVLNMFLIGADRMKRNKNVVMMKLHKFSLSLPEDVVVNLDGEAGFKGSFDFEVLPQAIEIFVNEKTYKKINELKN